MINQWSIDYVIFKASFFRPHQFEMSDKLDYIRSEVDLERVKDKLKKALQKSQVYKSRETKKTQHRARQKVTPETTLVNTDLLLKTTDTKSSISLSSKVKILSRLLILALFCLVLITIILAIIISTSEDEERVEQSTNSSTLVVSQPTKTSTTVQTSAIVQEVGCIDYDVNVITDEKYETVCSKGWIGDGVCDDMCNTLEFQFDQGDCCLTSPGSDCTQCQCFCPVNSSQFEPSAITCAAYDFDIGNADLNCPQAWIGDGFCDDDCNHPQFDFDNDDCCTANNSFWDNTCLDCQCYQCVSDHPCYVPPEVPLPLAQLNCDFMSDDGFCDDLCNHPEQV